MKIRLLVSALALGLCCTSQANAQLTWPAPGFTYFNRAGATLDDQRADLDACTPGVIASVQPPPPGTGVAAQYGLAGVLTEAAMNAQMQQVAEQRARFFLYENCMVMRGWRVVRMDDTLGQELDALDQPALAARLAPMVGAADPEGAIARVFANELAHPNASFYGQPRPVQIRSLSLQALPPDSTAAFYSAESTDIDPPRRPDRRALSRDEYRTRMAEYEVQREAYLEQRAVQREADRAAQTARRGAYAGLHGVGRHATVLRRRDLDSMRENSTVIVLRVSGGMHGAGVTLTRPGAEDRSVDMLTVVVPTPFFSDAEPQIAVATVPPGRWRVSGFVGPQGYVASLCMGAPTFEIAEGEVVFAGTFVFGGSGARLDLTLDAAREVLADAPPALAQRLRAAEYINGDTFDCGAGSIFYGYEIPDVAFADGYQFGSRAQGYEPLDVEPNTDAMK